MKLLSKTELHLFNEALRSSNPLAFLSDTVRLILKDSGGDRDLVLAKLEELRVVLQKEDRGQDEDRVLEVMDFLVGWSSPHSRIIINDPEKGPGAPPSRGSFATKATFPKPEIRRIFPGTSGGMWMDRHQAAVSRDLYFPLPPTAPKGQTIAILDMTGMMPTPGVLQEFILPLAQRIKGGIYGQFTLIVRTHDQGVADFIGLLAKEYDLNIFVALSSQAIQQAQPVGNVTNIDLATLDFVHHLGGQVSAAQVAEAAGIGKTAAGNRLVGLVKKGYMYRFEQPRREGDRYMDPRTFLDEQNLTGQAS